MSEDKVVTSQDKNGEVNGGLKVGIELGRMYFKGREIYRENLPRLAQRVNNLVEKEGFDVVMFPGDSAIRMWEDLPKEELDDLEAEIVLVGGDENEKMYYKYSDESEEKKGESERIINKVLIGKKRVLVVDDHVKGGRKIRRLRRNIKGTGREVGFLILTKKREIDYGEDVKVIIRSDGENLGDNPSLLAAFYIDRRID